MRTLLLNGSPREKGCTFTALSEVEKALNEAGVETEVLHIGREPLSGCLACGKCGGLDNRCVIDDRVNVALAKMREADALVVGSPVYYASANGALISFLDRMFYAGEGACFAGKPAACVVSARRAGTTAAFDQLNKYFTISGMPVVSSCYWNMVHGNRPEEVLRDIEGLRIMRTLGRNMAWLLRCIRAGQEAGFAFPPREAGEATNFIR